MAADYKFEEMRIGDYEWARRPFQDDVYASVEYVAVGATSQRRSE